MSDTIDYEAVQAELRANDYIVWSSINPYRKPAHIETPDGFLFYGNPLSSEEKQYAEVIEKAWAHYQEKKRYAAMEAVLTELVQESDTYSLWLTGEKVEGITNLELDLEINVKLLQKAKAILGKGE